MGQTATFIRYGIYCGRIVNYLWNDKDGTI